MAKVVGYDSPDDIVVRAIPENIQDEKACELPAPLTEHETLARLQELADKNTVRRSFLGLGYYDTITPSVIRRNVLQNPSWYTAYTPYQPEISQGRLEALLNFQTMVSDLTGLDVAGSSLLDEATAAAEAMQLMNRANRKTPKGSAFLVDKNVFTQTIAVLTTRAEAAGVDVVVADLSDGLPEGDFFGVLVQNPDANGQVRDLTALVEAAHARKALVAIASDLLALALVKTPGDMGADIAVGSTQRFGVPMGFGGPHAAFMAVKEGLQRNLPGRLVGVSHDASGDKAYRLALQTREQHIRREKATSNICTSQVLLAVMASMYAVFHGPDGISAIARQTHSRATSLAASLVKSGFELQTDSFFDTVVASAPGKANELVAAAYDAGFLVRKVDADTIALSCDETTTEADLSGVMEALGGDFVAEEQSSNLGDTVRRTSDFLTHPVFNSHHSETAMMRYLKGLSDKDYALDRGMIPLGSCTMKLNAATELEPITWPQFAGLHPFAPEADTVGSRELATELEQFLVSITGYHSVSLQPNSGAQGEFAGLLAIRAYHDSRGDTDRRICLIPTSAHGTNAASAVMAGLKVVTVATDDHGNVDMDDLHAKCDKYADTLAAIMVTYPSTHGVFEEKIRELIDKVHSVGGQVYVDGANLNAQVGWARPGAYGSDVSHLNLHKTFSIPHGGGGPGVGPIGVAEHLVPFLPSAKAMASPSSMADDESAVGPVSAAPLGSAGVLPISWAYIRMMGGEALRRATTVAVVSANYISKRLENAFPTLYVGEGNLVAHECILDLRPLTKETGITVDDVAKRLIDYGFHAPTMSFPVAGTLMVEPTESESLEEVDRFIDAMISIRAEADKVKDGVWPADDNPLVGAPHTALSVTANTWEHAYTREEAAYPGATSPVAKYWPPVRRIDGAYGDRNLVCSCPPMEDLAEED